MQFAIIGYSMINVYVESVWIYITFLANHVLGHFISAASRLFFMVSLAIIKFPKFQ